MKRQMKGGAEYDAFTKWRHYLIWRPGEVKKIKQRANRRDRRSNRQKMRPDFDD